MVFDVKGCNVNDDGPPTVSGKWVCFSCPKVISVHDEELRAGQYPLFEEWIRRNSKSEMLRADMKKSETEIPT